MDNTSRIQLELISEISALLAKANIENCLMGGWALDFLAGQVTRSHDDVDYFVWATDAQSIQHVLTANDYIHHPASHPEGSLYFRKHEQWIDFTFLERDEEGRIRVAGRFRDWLLPELCFSSTTASLDGFECVVLNAEGQHHIKAEFQKQFPDQSIRPKDLDDLKLLTQLIAPV